MSATKRAKTTKRIATYASFVVPALLLYVVFVVYPVGSSMFYSLTNWDGINPHFRFIGLDNFKRLFRDAEVLASLKVSLIYVAAVALIQNGIALFLAICADRPIRLKTFYRSVIFVPALMSALSIGYVWSYMYQPVGGVINTALDYAGLGNLAHDWLGDAKYTLWSVIAVNVWQYVGTGMLIYLAGLQAVPTDLYEAADIDGCGRWGKFVHVTFPLIAPALTINLVLSVIAGLKMFDLVFAMTGGGPGYATQVLSLVVYKKAFMQSDMGYGTAIATVLFFIILLVTIVQLTLLRKREVEM